MTKIDTLTPTLVLKTLKEEGQREVERLRQAVEELKHIVENKHEEVSACLSLTIVVDSCYLLFYVIFIYLFI